MDQFFENLRAHMNSQRSEMSCGQLSVPTDAHLAFIPQRQRSNVLVMTAAPLHLPEMPTAFIGTIRQNYTDALWQEDVRKWKTHFERLGLNQQYHEIKFLPLNEDNDILDGAKAVDQTEELLELANQLPAGKMIRVIHLGTGYSKFLYEAITYLLKEWKEPGGAHRENKLLQFITSGDTENRDLCDFCLWLCISGVCQYVTFYNTKQYHPFGYCKSQYKAK